MLKYLRFLKRVSVRTHLILSFGGVRCLKPKLQEPAWVRATCLGKYRGAV